MDAALIALMSLALAGIGASTWRLLARIDAATTQLSERTDTTNTRIDNMATEIYALGQRVARIEGHLLGLEAPAPAGPG